MLTGKGKPQFTHHIDTGDFVVIINADKVVLTSDKGSKKVIYRHSGYPGGLTEITIGDLLQKDARKVVEARG